MKKLILNTMLCSVLFIACKEGRIRSKFAGAWDVQRIEIISFDNGIPSEEEIFNNIGQWSFLDNGLSNDTYNRSVLSLKESVPCLFNDALSLNGERYSGIVPWGPDEVSDKRIMFAYNGGQEKVILDVEKINRFTFVFTYLEQDPQEPDFLIRKERYVLKRTNR
ncbi:MAG: hypothetical protein LPK45_00450 [Bacteroidota bacterium]|nr:hypothetical protein [Bacteroidota bacterium]MDX5429496.1 hypothetical protein [Bacteroidota bacterium]MDX5468281.1 hypothetical protein [Bacteroidota bacterium]